MSAKIPPHCVRNVKKSLVLGVVCIALGFSSPRAYAVDVVLSVADNIGNMIGGLTFTDGDVIEFDSTTNTATLVFAETLITPGADVDAFHILPNGNYLISVLFNNRTLGGFTFNDGDLVEYNPTTNTASLYFLGEADFVEVSAGGGDINAVTTRPNGNIIFSLTAEQTQFRGVTYSDGDLIEYDPNTDQGSLLLSQATLCDDGDCDIVAVHLLANGHFVMSTFDDESISGITFHNGDLFEYDPLTDTATLFFSEDSFLDSNGHNVDAVYVPEDVGDDLGDMDCSGAVDINDVAPFVQALLDPAGYMAAFPGCDINRADTNSDNDRNSADLSGFLDRLL